VGDILRSRSTYIKLPREAGESRLTINAWEDMKSKLLGSFDNDMFALSIPTDHMMIFRTLEETDAISTNRVNCLFPLKKKTSRTEEKTAHTHIVLSRKLLEAYSPTFGLAESPVT
jgi:hypothetical protein